ncbi:MAG: ribosome maturation factor RimM [Gammaproteobacteria bacterium]|nr:ribosome maturation factor RimM [Gammaproteobacteria bacterium]
MARHNQENRHSDAEPPRIAMGRIGGTHGVKGWLKLQSWTSPAANILDFAHLQVETRQGAEQLRIDQSRWRGDSLLVHFEGYDEPELARGLTGLEVSVAVSALAELEAGEYYWHQLQGLRVVNLAGECFGRVDHLLETGANDVLVVAPDAGSIDRRRRLIPFVADRVVRRVDLETGVIAVDWGVDFLD